MSHVKSDPAFVTQFRRQWNGARVAIKFLSEMTAAELDRLAVERGAAAVAAMPKGTVNALTASERRDLAQRIGRQWLTELAERRRRERAEHPARRPG
ncbi:MAG TPA: hypothetical protein VN823_15260 [Stellaceae bacterium]|nr:hypothetical protein [Stellaceae bacterium]